MIIVNVCNVNLFAVVLFPVCLSCQRDPSSGTFPLLMCFWVVFLYLINKKPLEANLVFVILSIYIKLD